MFFSDSLKLRASTGAVVFDGDEQIVIPRGVDPGAAGEGQGPAAGAPPEGGPAGAPGQAGGQVPPLGITGGGLTVPPPPDPKIGIDWINCTFPVGRISEVVSLLSGWLGREELGAGMGWYKDHGYRFKSGAVVAWADCRSDAWVSINGDSLELIDDVHGLLGELLRLGCRCSRLDVALDCPHELLSLDDVAAAHAAGAVVGFKRHKLVREDSGGELRGLGHFFGLRGRKGSGRYVRFYDKTLESRGVVVGVRCEVEISGKLASEWFTLLANEDPGDAFMRAMGRCLGGAIDFRENTGAAHVNRRPRCPFWQRIIDIIGRCKLRVPRPVVPLQRTLSYVKQAFSNSFGRAVLAAEAQFSGAGMDAAVDVVQSWLAGVVLHGVRQVLKLGEGADVLTKRLDFDALFNDVRAAPT